MLNLCIEKPLAGSCSILSRQAWRIASIVCLLLGLIGCGSAPKAPVEKVVVVPEPVVAKPVFTPEQELRFNQALQLAKSGNSDQAKRAFTALTKEVPRMSGAWANLGFIALEQNDTELAGAHFNEALSVNPDNVPSKLGLAEIKIRNADFKAAAEALEQVLDAKSDYWIAHYKLGVLYDLYLGQKSKALKHYRAYAENSGQNDVDTVKNWIKLLELEQ